MDFVESMPIHAVAIMFVWVPFALAAFVVDHWAEEPVLRWRQRLAQPAQRQQTAPSTAIG